MNEHRPPSIPYVSIPLYVHLLFLLVSSFSKYFLCIRIGNRIFSEAPPKAPRMFTKYANLGIEYPINPKTMFIRHLMANLRKLEYFNSGLM